MSRPPSRATSIRGQRPWDCSTSVDQSSHLDRAMVDNAFDRLPPVSGNACRRLILEHQHLNWRRMCL